MRNPTRRSRNIGTSKQGHGANNRLSLPLAVHWNSNHATFVSFFENLHQFDSETRLIGNKELVFLSEKPRPSVRHACSINDIVRVLSLIPSGDLNGLQLIVLRQPKRKEEILTPVWGRYIPLMDVQKWSGSAIILEALDLRRSLNWQKPLGREGSERLERLRAQGHRITETNRHFEITSTLEAVRETQLYETLPHEVGHHVHSTRDEHFFERTKREKEDFAERYVREFTEKFGAILRHEAR